MNSCEHFQDRLIQILNDYMWCDPLNAPTCAGQTRCSVNLLSSSTSCLFTKGADRFGLSAAFISLQKTTTKSCLNSNVTRRWRKSRFLCAPTAFQVDPLHDKQPPYPPHMHRLNVWTGGIIQRSTDRSAINYLLSICAYMPLTFLQFLSIFVNVYLLLSAPNIVNCGRCASPSPKPPVGGHGLHLFNQISLLPHTWNHQHPYLPQLRRLNSQQSR